MLRVDVQSSTRAVTLFCCGRIVLGVELETLRCRAVSRHEADLILDLCEVSGIDAAGLGLLVELHRNAQQRRGSLRIANVSPRVRRPIALTGLDQVLHCCTGSTDECCAMTA